MLLNLRILLEKANLLSRGYMGVEISSLPLVLRLKLKSTVFEIELPHPCKFHFLENQ